MSSQVSHLSLWETVKTELRTLFSAADYDTWIGSLNAVSIKDGNTLVLEAPTVLTEAWVNSNYTDVIRRQLTLVSGRNMEFQLSASASSQSKEKFADVAPIRQNHRQSANSPAPAIKSTNTFENFIVGPENEMAHGAALAVSKEPGSNYNPLFIYGQTGLGKTHNPHYQQYKHSQHNTPAPRQPSMKAVSSPTSAPQSPPPHSE